MSVRDESPALPPDAPPPFALKLSKIAYKEVDRRYQVRPHANTLHQWYVVLHGRVDMTLENGVHPLRAEESILIAPHAIRSPRCGGRSPAYLWALFDLGTLQLNSLYNRPLSTPDELRPDLHALTAEVRKPAGANTVELTEALLVRLLVGLGRIATRPEHRKKGAASGTLSPLGSNARHDVVERLDAFLARNLHRQIARDEMAAAVNLSAPHAARLFRAATGSTLNQRLTELRLEHAKELLRDSTLSITQIATEVGFRSFSHFSKTFHEQVGVAPSDYRRRGGGSWPS